MEMSPKKIKAERVVYVQLRQAVRDKKTGILVTTKTQMTTVHNATIEQVENALRIGIKATP